MNDSPDNRSDGSERPEDRPAAVENADRTPAGPPAPPERPAAVAASTPAAPQQPASSYVPPMPGSTPPRFAGSASNPPYGQQSGRPYPQPGQSPQGQYPQQGQSPQGQYPQQGQAPYDRVSPAQQQGPGTQPHPQQTTSAFGQPNNDSAPQSSKGDKKRGSIPLIAALAVGALVGGVSGAGVAALVNAGSQSSQSSTAAEPANVTVNDGADATIITAVAASAGPSVVTISVTDASGQGAGTGSGVILSEDGYVLTNTHVVTLDGASAAPAVSVQTSDGRLYQAEIVGTDPISDLAVIQIDGTGFQPIEFADSSELNVGDTAVAIGAPLGLSNTVTNGIVSSLNRSITVASSAAPGTPDDQAPEGEDGQSPFDFWQFGPEEEEQGQSTASSTISLSVIQTDAAINPGNSGGALLDAEGRLIGINVAIASAGQGQTQSAAGSIGVGFAIPSNLAERIASEIIETGSGSHGLLGAGVNDVTARDATVVGALIEDVQAGGAAEAAGLQIGDVVTRVGDIPITSRTDLTAQIRSLAAGAETTITYVRDGDARTTDVTLGAL